MTVSNTQSHVAYNASGAVNQAFPIGFLFTDAAHLRVFTRAAGADPVARQIGVDYTVTGAGDPAGGAVVWIGASPAGETVDIYRWVPPLQLTAYETGGPFPARSHERALDVLTMCVQQVLARIGGADFSLAALEFLARDPVNFLSAWNALGGRIAAVADPVDDADAATKQWTLDKIIGGGSLPPPDPSDIGKVMMVAAGPVAGWFNLLPASGDEPGRLLAVGESGLEWIDRPARNLLDNAGFNVAQRGASFASPNNGAYTLDRWRLLSDGDGIAAVTRSATAPPGCAHSMKFTVAVPNKRFGIVQGFEAAAAIALQGRTVSLSFKARTTAGKIIGGVRGALVQYDGAEAQPSTLVIDAWGETPTLAADWSYVNAAAAEAPGVDAWSAISVEGMTLADDIRGLALLIWLDDDDAAVDDELFIADLRLTLGAHAAVEIEPRPIGEEMATAQRYFYTTYGNIAPGTASAPNGSYEHRMADVTMIALNLSPRWPTPMRINPTVTIYSPSTGASGKARNLSGGADINAVAVNINTRGCVLRTDSAIGNVLIGAHVTAEAEF